QGDRNLADERGEAGEFVVVRLGGGIEDAEGPELGDAFGVVGGNGRADHAGGSGRRAGER
ncbi:MAG: hypothetical protein CFE26_25675, partial [Verrucomicrobiales bacterium VVV1]